MTPTEREETGTDGDARSGPAVTWKIVGASVRGAGHEADGTEGQDAHAWAVVGPWAIAVVCDGAGSAALGGLGARVGAAEVAAALADVCASPPPGPVAAARDAWTDAVVEAVKRARRAVERALADAPDGMDDRGVPLFELAHATLVAAAVHPGGGLFAHIGDGTAAALRDGEVRARSAAANGDYANETFFFTESDWDGHLRLTAFDGPVDLVVLMSDGGAALATNTDGAPHRGFFDPVSRFLDDADAETGRAALAETLGHERTHAVTSDDKTIVWMRPTIP